MKNKNFDDCSTLKFFNFEGWSSQKIIDKYEIVLASREKQITDLSIEIGSLNERIANTSDKLKSTQEENEYLKNRLQKRENLLTQELNNKEIMFMRLERKEQECDELKKKIEQLISKGHKENPIKETPFKNYTTEHSQSTEGLKIDYNIYNNKTKENFVESKKEEVIKDNTKPLFQQSNFTNDNKSQTKTGSTLAKSSALDKIRELKEKKTNAPLSRISLTSSIIENPPTENAVSSVEIKDQIPQTEDKTQSTSNSSKTEDSSYTNI